MEKNRIQKLLLSEYKDLSDLVLVESPFAETTRNGRGVREVALGLTSSKLIIAADILRDANEFTCPSELDPSIETLELISVYPLEFITLSIFRRKRRKTLKARLIDGRVNYFELGGINRRKKFWNLWCKHIQILLLRKEYSSSLSETTAASSSSNSTHYFLSSDADCGVEGKNRNRCVCRLWAHHCGAGDVPLTWTKKDVYMGPSHNELGPNYYSPLPIKIPKSSIKHVKNELLSLSDHDTLSKSYYQSYEYKYGPIERRKICPCNDGLCEILFTQEKDHNNDLERGDYTNPIELSSPIITYKKNLSKLKSGKKSQTSSHDSVHTAVPKLSRFGFGVEEKCTAGLFLPSSREAKQSISNEIRGSEIFIDPYQIIESGLTIWEQDKWRRNCNIGDRPRKFRRYGITTAPHFLYALGLWSIHEGDKISVQSKRSMSCINVRSQPSEIELKLPISKKQLTTSISMSTLEQEMSFMPSEQDRVLLFWTPNYWYRPQAATNAYQELRNHLHSLREFQQTIKEKGCRRYSGKKNNKYCVNDNDPKTFICDKATCVLNKIFFLKDKKKKNEKKKENNEGTTRSIGKYRDLLKMNSKITVWNLDSTTLAKQLTLIDRDLFLRIPPEEIRILIHQKSSRNAPNIGAVIAFSHRISCLISTELLSIRKLNMRARMLARFINAANKCFAMGNFQSCRTILAGLQSPAIYRLKSTWSHVKTHHSSVYEIMSKLCKIFKCLRSKVYIKAWESAEKYPPLLPYICDIFIRILGLDNNSKSLYYECSEQYKIARSRLKKKKWDGGSTFLTQINEQKNNSKQEKINLEKSIQNPPSNNVKKIMYQCKQEPKQMIDKRNTAKKIISALMKLRYGKYTPIKSSRKSIFWAAKQLILARKYYEHWQTFVMTARIITENKKRQKPIDMKTKKIEEVTNWLKECQQYAREYDFSPQKLAWEFLLKARYKEEKENFYISRQLEPLLD